MASRLASWLEYDLCDSCPVYFGFVRTADLDSYQAWAITYKDYRPLFSVSDYGLRPWIKHCGYLPWCYYEFYVYPEYHLHFACNYLPSIFLLTENLPGSGRKSADFISAEIENSYRNYIFELEEKSQQIRLFRHEYQGKLLLMKTLLKKQDYQTLDQELQDMLEDIPTAEQLVTSGNVLENNPDLKTTKSNPSYHGYGIRLIRQIAEKYNGAADFSATKESFICRVMLTLDGVDEEKNTPV